MSDNTSNSEQVQYKRCRKCGEEKQRIDFHSNKSSKDGLTSFCKQCQSIRSKEWRESNLERERENNRKWRENNPDRVRERSRKWRENNPERHQENVRKWGKNNPDRAREHRNKWRTNNLERALEKDRERSRRSHLKRNYGISEQEYTRMLNQQKGVCAICEESCKTGKRLAVDHSHITGKIRGLLCFECNRRLGIVESFMEQALEYLDKYD